MAKTTKKATSKKAKKAAPKNEFLAALKAKYPHVFQIKVSNEEGKPLRINIQCTGTVETPKCKNTREIATQDAFQVSRCTDCQRLFAKIRRRKSAA